MASIYIENLKYFQRTYLENFLYFEFNSLFHLIFALFKNHIHGQKEIVEIETLLEETGYSNLKEIPKYEVEAVKEIIITKRIEWQRQSDSEYLTFKLLAAIQSKSVIVIIDATIIEEIEKPISISHKSTITFINQTKIESISFRTL